MKKIILILMIVNSLFAIPQCKNYQKTGICYEKHPKARNIIVLNMNSKAIIFNAQILKYSYPEFYNIKNVKLGAYQRFRIEQKFYYDSKNIREENIQTIFNYKFDDKISPINIYKDTYKIYGKDLNRIKITKKVLSRVQNRNNNIKINQTHIRKKADIKKIIHIEMK